MISLSSKIFQTLEFDKIQKQLQTFTKTEIAKMMIQQIEPSNNFEIVQEWQDETAESLEIIQKNYSIPVPSMINLESAIKRLELGASLNGQEIAAIGRLLTSTQQVGDFFSSQEEEDNFFPSLQKWVDQTVYLPDLVRAINQAVSEDGQILTSASQELAKIRRQQQQAEDQVRERLNDVLKNRANMLSDTIITIRNNRYVLPVKAEYRSSIGGTVHDQSSTGQTLYMEPQVVVNLNNRRNQLQVEERAEIDRILIELSGELMPYHHDIRQNERIMGQLDFIQARGNYARSINAVKPKLSEDRHVALWQARHPLIPQNQIVANDIIIGENYNALVITGPNTGGKTILLKTLGLLHLMGQSGLHIPAEEGSQIGLFDQVFADIGDEQSIEQNLSTFSSHMTNIVKIIDHATHESLLLFDELGSGTDPQEGAALAMAILDYIQKIHATVMATTHYPELKVYAHETPKTINASMEFDSESLSPTYRLLIGIPGRSNALDISKRLGLRADILQSAKEGVSTDSQSMNDLVANLERERRESELKNDQAHQALDEAEKFLNDLKTEYQRFMDRKDRLNQQAVEEANEKVKEAEDKANKIIQEIRELQLEQGQNTTIKEHVLIDKQKQMGDLRQPEHLRKNKVLKKAKQKNTFKVGDDVEVLTYGQRGTIIEESGKDSFVVQMGILKMAIPAKELAPLKKVEPKQNVNVQRRAGSKVSTQLDLRGQRYEEAMSNLSTYLDQALLSHHPMVTIIHGIGTGAIREGVQKALKKHPQVDRFNYSPPNAGGHGSTQVHFK